MPKVKTSKAAAKRFTMTGTGKLKRMKAGKQHILTKKSRKTKRDLRKPYYVASGVYCFCGQPIPLHITTQLPAIHNSIDILTRTTTKKGRKYPCFRPLPPTYYVCYPKKQD